MTDSGKLFARMSAPPPLRARLAGAVIGLLLGGACAETPPRIPGQGGLGAPATPAPQPPPAARWVETGGATVVGPTLDAGTLVLLGGRRALVLPNGSLENEKAPSPEPIREIIEVPTASGTHL